jgi:hypothetical protein
MPGVGFEATIPMFERAQTVHALDRAATVIGLYLYSVCSVYITYKYSLQQPVSKHLLS